MKTWWGPVCLLLMSNVFMTYAWYGHLKRKESALWQAILMSWGIAFFEYCLMVPANRWGSAVYEPYQLKILQEVITLIVFVGFALFYLGAVPRWNHLAAFGCIIAAVFFTMIPGRAR